MTQKTKRKFNQNQIQKKKSEDNSPFELDKVTEFNPGKEDKPIELDLDAKVYPYTFFVDDTGCRVEILRGEYRNW